MARATFVKSARKDNPVAKVGESYWWWSFRYGGKHYSKEQPKPSQLTQSDFLSTVYSLLEELPSEMDESAVSDLEGEIEGLIEELEDNLSNMPEQLQDGSIVQERIDMLNDWLSDLENIDTDIPEQNEGESDEDYEDRCQERREEIANEVMNSDPGF